MSNSMVVIAGEPDITQGLTDPPDGGGADRQPTISQPHSAAMTPNATLGASRRDFDAT